ncbi:MAG: gliding motility-associated C-terminal domain-containing protein, partial [Bacteroidota bacterium]
TTGDFTPGIDRLNISWISGGSIIDIGDPVTIADGDTLIVLKFNVLNINSNGIPVDFQIDMLPTENLIPQAVYTENFTELIPTVLEGGVISLNDEIQVTATASDITCDQLFSDLAGMANNPQVTYQWYNNDTLYANQRDTIAAAAGIYTLIGTNGNCQDTTTIAVSYDTISPSNITLNNGAVTCLSPMTSLEVTAELATENPVFEWFLPDNTTLQTLNTTTSFSLPGQYIVQVTNPANGCFRFDTTQIVDNRNFPDLSIATANNQLDCNTAEALLQVGLSSANSELFWTSLDGNILTTEDMLLVNEAGSYVLNALDTLNGCTNADTISIQTNFTLPDVDVLGNETITCASPTTTIEAVTSAINPMFSWKNLSGVQQGNNPTQTFMSQGDWWLVVEDQDNGCVDSLLFSTTVDTIPGFFELVTLNQTITCSSGLAQFNASSSIAAPDYQWLDDEQNQVGAGLTYETNEAGEYTLRGINDDNGCFIDIPFMVTIDTISPLFMVMGETELTCLNNSNTITLISSGSSSYECSWENVPLASCTVELDLPGSYLASVVDLMNGCRTDTLISITPNENAPDVSIAEYDSISCLLQTVDIFVEPVANVTYEWMAVDNSVLSMSNMLTVDQAGVYTISLLDTINGCSSLDTVIVESIVNEPVTIVGVSGILDCNNTSVNLTITSDDAADQTVWLDENGEVINPQMVSEAGFYYALTTNMVSGCSVQDTIEVSQDITTLPTEAIFVNPTNEVITCANLMVELGWDNPQIEATTRWYSAQDPDISVETTASVDAPGAYILEVTNSINGCMASDTILVVADTQEPALTLLPVSSLNCIFSETTLGVANPDPSYNYQWTSLDGVIESPNAPSTVVLAAGNYSLEVIDTNNGCTNTEDIVISANMNAPDNIEVAIEQPVCGAAVPTGSIIMGQIVGGTPPYTTYFGEQRDSLSMIFNDLPIGSYPLIVQDANGCSLDTILQIVEAANLEALLSVDNSALTLGESALLTLTPNTSFSEDFTISWVSNGMVLDTCMNCFDLSVTPSYSQNYEVLVQSATGCTAEAEIFIFVSQDVPAFFPNAFSPNNDGQNDVWRPFLGAGYESLQMIQVYNRWGGLVYEANNSDYEKGWTGQQGGQLCPSGVYIYTAELVDINGKIIPHSGDFFLFR